MSDGDRTNGPTGLSQVMGFSSSASPCSWSFFSLGTSGKKDGGSATMEREYLRIFFDGVNIPREHPDILEVHPSIHTFSECVYSASSPGHPVAPSPLLLFPRRAGLPLGLQRTNMRKCSKKRAFAAGRRMQRGQTVYLVDKPDLVQRMCVRRERSQA
jgi:hypothetical protein